MKFLKILLLFVLITPCLGGMLEEKPNGSDFTLTFKATDKENTLVVFPIHKISEDVYALGWTDKQTPVNSIWDGSTVFASHFGVAYTNFMKTLPGRKVIAVVPISASAGQFNSTSAVYIILEPK